MLYSSRIDSFSDKNILVIGDLILDVYLKGSSTRLSPEAPVPVVDVHKREVVLGGAANVVCNLRSLGANATFVSVVGNDAAGDEALELLKNIGVHTETIERSKTRETLVKTRIMAGGQIVTRFDSGTTTAIDDDTCERLEATIMSQVYSCDAIILSDYDKGVITAPLLEMLKDLRNQFPKFIAVDSKRLSFFASLYPSLVKPNYDEAIKLLNIRSTGANKADQMTAEGRQLSDITKAQIVALTLDEEGAVVFEQGNAVHRSLARQVRSPHVAGAGDTYLSAFVLAYLTCGEIPFSAELANAAAGLAIDKMATAACTCLELKMFFNSAYKKIADPNELEALCEFYKDQGKKIVFTNGCFDILHSGHVTYLHCAREQGDVLIVGINTDESIKRIKGSHRPVNPLNDRIDVLSALTSVNHIVPFGSPEDDTPIPIIEIVKPDVFVKGGDYTLDTLPEAKTVELFGGKIMFVPHIPDHSTTGILKRVHALSPEKYTV